MSNKCVFSLTSRDHLRKLPPQLVVARQETETVEQVALKLLAYILLFRDRLQLEVNLRNDSIPFVPDLVQLDYELRPILWVECGECSAAKLDKLAVKVPEARIWVVRPSVAGLDDLRRAMSKAHLRRDRYDLMGFDDALFAEMCALVRSRNQLMWVRGDFEPPEMQFDFNGLWFEMPFAVDRF